MKQNQNRGALLVFASAILYGSYGVWAILIGEGFGSFFQGYVRAILISLVLVAYLTFSKRWVPMPKKEWKYFYVFGFTALLTQAPIYYAFQNSGVGIANLMLYSSTLIASYFAGRYLVGEKITRIKILSAILAVGGLGLVFYTSLGTFAPLALSMAVLGGTAAGTQFAVSKNIPSKFSPAQIALTGWIIVLLTHLPLSLLLGERQVPLAISTEWISMLCFAAAGVLASICVFAGYKHLDASLGGLIGLLEIIFAFLFGALVFNEAVTANMVAGSIIILFAASVPHLQRVLRHTRT